METSPIKTSEKEAARHELVITPPYHAIGNPLLTEDYREMK